MPVILIDDSAMAAEAAREELGRKSTVRRLLRATEHAQMALWNSDTGMQCLTPEQARALARAQASLDTLSVVLSGGKPPEAA